MGSPAATYSWANAELVSEALYLRLKSEDQVLIDVVQLLGCLLLQSFDLQLHVLVIDLEHLESGLQLRMLELNVMLVLQLLHMLPLMLLLHQVGQVARAQTGPFIPRVVGRRIIGRAILGFQLADVPGQDVAENERGEDRCPQQGPNHDGEHTGLHHVRCRCHLRDEVSELGSANHCPTDDPTGISHEWCADDLGENARAEAHESAPPKSLEGEEILEGDGEGHCRGEEDANHPAGHALRLADPDVVRLLPHRKRHAGDEATPKVGAAHVCDLSVEDQDADHQNEQELVMHRQLRVLLLVGNASQRPSNRLGPPTSAQSRGPHHEDDAEDQWEERHEGDGVLEAEENIVENKRQDVVDEGGGDDGLSEVRLERLGLVQQAERDADAGRRQGGAGGEAVLEVEAVGHGQQAARDEGQ
mmetsp:Transcript_122915/g.392913  ORF Transcript_122915/g.392913 Transcript_122915/m.392913 type:complete len:416 (-) Transcript_122915:665-1912(-)